MGARRTTGSAIRWMFAIATTVFIVTGTSPAYAHDVLIESDPEHEEVLDSSPEEIVLTYNAEVMDVGGAITVVDSENEEVATGEIIFDGHDVILPVEDELAPGGHAVRWRVVSSDGHPISGAFTFNNGEGPPPPDLNVRSDPKTDDTDAADDAAAAAQGGSSGGVPRIVVIAAGGAALGVIVFAVSRMASRRTSDT